MAADIMKPEEFDQSSFEFVIIADLLRGSDHASLEEFCGVRFGIQRMRSCQPE